MCYLMFYKFIFLKFSLLFKLFKRAPFKCFKKTIVSEKTSGRIIMTIKQNYFVVQFSNDKLKQIVIN